MEEVISLRDKILNESGKNIINIRDREFIDSVTKSTNDNLKDIILFVYLDHKEDDLDTINKFVDEINELCRGYRKNNVYFFVYLFSDHEPTFYKGIDKCNNLLKKDEIDANGIYSRCNVYHYKTNLQTFHNYIPKAEGFIQIYKNTDNFKIIEFFEKKCVEDLMNKS